MAEPPTGEQPAAPQPAPTASAPASFRFLTEHRLRRPADFERVYARRASANDGVLLVFADRNTLGHARLGMSVSRKVGNAVVRNRWKRVLREAFRLGRSELPAGVDLVVIPRFRGRPMLAPIQASLVQNALRAAKRIRTP